MAYYRGIARNMSEVQRIQNILMSRYVAELPCIEAFNYFYSNLSFTWVPKWVQKKLRPLAFKCFKAGFDTKQK